MTRFSLDRGNDHNSNTFVASLTSRFGDRTVNVTHVIRSYIPYNSYYVHKQLDLWKVHIQRH